VVVLCDALTGRGATWSTDDTIVFTPDSSVGTSLMRVSANGGTPSPVTALREGEVSHRWPQVFRHGSALLYTGSSNIGDFNDGTIVVQSLPNGQPKTLIHGGHFGRYVPSGHITYVHDGRLFAAPFDVDALELTGEAVPVLERISRTANTGGAQLDLSSTGVAVYVAEEEGIAQPLEWLTRDGAIMPLGTAIDWSNVRMSPDGSRVALDRFDGQQSDIWLFECGRAT
jgi:eukaryotic-like serine/threonine-protein kinase